MSGEHFSGRRAWIRDEPGAISGGVKNFGSSFIRAVRVSLYYKQEVSVVLCRLHRGEPDVVFPRLCVYWRRKRSRLVSQYYYKQYPKAPREREYPRKKWEKE